MIVVGLTGSIGTGKTTTARMFADEGIATIGADEIVHRLYSGPAAALIGEAFPGTVRDGAVDRVALSSAVVGDPDALRRLESIIHPLVAAEERAFVEGERRAGAEIAVIDIPLLFETGAETRVDRVVTTTCAPKVQRARVLARPGMTAAKFEAILARQTPDSQKRARADFVVETDHGLEAAREAVRHIVARLRKAAHTN